MIYRVERLLRRAGNIFVGPHIESNARRFMHCDLRSVMRNQPNIVSN